MGKGGTETVDTIPEELQPIYYGFVKDAKAAFDEGLTMTKDPLETMGEESLIDFVSKGGIQSANMLGSAMEDAYNISKGADPIDVSALQKANVLRAKQEMVPTTQMYGGMGSMTAGVGGGRQQLDQSDAALRLAASNAQLEYDAQADAQAREDAQRIGLGQMQQDFVGAGTFAGDVFREIGKERSDYPYEGYMKFRDLIDFRQPTQTAVQGGK